MIRVVVALAFSSLACLGEPKAPAISIAQLLAPATRLEALRQYFLLSGERENSPYRRNFDAQHAAASVIEWRRAGEPSRYVVTWRVSFEAERWPEELEAGVIRPEAPCRYLIFEADGTSQKEEPGVAEGLVEDWRGEGVPEVLSQGFGQIDGELVPYFMMKPLLGSGAEPSLVVAFDRYAADRPPADPWGYRLTRREPGPGWEWQIGRWPAHGGPERTVRVRWDRDARAWTVEASGAETPVRLWQGAEVAARPPPAPAQAARKVPPAEGRRGVEIPPAARHSLAALSDDALLASMTTTPATLMRQAADQARWAGLRALAPAEAARQGVLENRPPATWPDYPLIFAGDATEAPDEGDIWYSDAPSGCFAPSGGFEYFLHCAREGSFVAAASNVEDSSYIPLARGHQACHFQRRELPVEEARHFFQTVWWLRRARTRTVVKRAVISDVGFSTGDGTARVTLRAGSSLEEIEGTRFDTSFPSFPRYPGLGLLEAAYDPSSFATLTGLLFRQRYPEVVSLDTDSRRPEEIARERASALELLQMAEAGLLPIRRLTPILQAAAALGWSEMAPAFRKLQAELPPPPPQEREVTELEREIAGWVEKYGEPATESGRAERRPAAVVREAASPAIPGLEPIVSTRPTPTAAVRAQFAPLDALYDRRDRLSAEQSESELRLGYLRRDLAQYLAELDCFNDEEKLAERAGEASMASHLALYRLARLSPARALAVLEKKPSGVDVSDEEFNERLQAELEPPSSAEERARALKILSRSYAEEKADPDFSAELWALTVVAPPDQASLPEDPPAAAAVLGRWRGSITAGEDRYSTLPLALARLQGGAAWPELLKALPPQATPPAGLAALLPALTLLAQREPAKYREPLHEILATQLRQIPEDTRSVAWAIWQLDLRDLAPGLERFVAENPRDEITPDADALDVLKQDEHDRFLGVRQVLLLWQEEDALTRARLLVAAAAARAREFAEMGNGALETLRAQLADAAKDLPPAQLARLRRFIEWCGRHRLVDGTAFETFRPLLLGGIP